MNSSVVTEFSEDIDLFRRWVLDSDVVALRRHDGQLTGELGLMLLKPAAHEALRQAIPGLVVEIWAYMRTELERLGYTSLLNDRGKSYILFGPLALLQSGAAMGIEIGAVQGHVDWLSSRGTNLVVTSVPTGDVRLIRMKAKRGKDEEETRRKIRKFWVAGDEVLLSYQPHVSEADSSGTSPVGSVAKEKIPRESNRSRKKKKRSRAVEEPVTERDPFGRMFTTDPGYRIPKRKKTTSGDEEIAEPDVHDVDSSSSSSEDE